MSQAVILITGCSSGIGRALAQAFHARGAIVYASARKPETLAELAQAGMKTLALDVCDEKAIAAAIEAIGAQTGRLDMVINNAGYGQFGAVADLDAETLRKQFEVNIIAPVQVVRAALPLLRKSQRALVVNIGSVSGVLTTPFAGAYCASKAALHALTDAMRLEFAPFGIRAMTVQPGQIASPFGDNGTSAVRMPEDSMYASMRALIVARAQVSQQGGPTPAPEFAAALAEAALSANPPALFRYGKQSFFLPFVARWLPIGIRDGMLKKKFGLQK